MANSLLFLDDIEKCMLLGRRPMFFNTRLDSDFNESETHISTIIAQSR